MNSGALDTHFGLGRAASVDVRVVLPGGRTASFTSLAANRAHDLDLAAP